MLQASGKKIDLKETITYGDTSFEESNHFTYNSRKQYPIRVESIGITHPSKNYFIERKHADYYILEYIISGKGYVTYDGKKSIVEKNDIYLIHPGMKHRYGADLEKPYEKIWINFYSSVFTDIISAYGLSNSVIFTNTNCQNLFEELLDLAKNYSDNEEIYLKVSEILFKIILKLVTNIEEQKVSATAIKIKEVLDRSIYRKVTVEDLCLEINLSKSQVCREFKKYYNMTPYQYLLNRRINIAQNLLVKTKISIKEISESLCFADEYYFSNIFKKKNKMSPLAYRKNVKNEE